MQNAPAPDKASWRLEGSAGLGISEGHDSLTQNEPLQFSSLSKLRVPASRPAFGGQEPLHLPWTLSP